SRARPDQLDRRSRRTQYVRQLRRWLNQLLPEWTIEELTTEPDLARSFSGRYTRGVISRGQVAWAVIGCGADEEASTADEILAYGILWLDWLRQHGSTRVVEGLKIFLPPDRAETVLTRLALLDSSLAKWELFETDTDGRHLQQRDSLDIGN